MKLRGAQMEVFRAAKNRKAQLVGPNGELTLVMVRMFLALWRRQGGKTTIFSHIALFKMMKKAWELVTFASASLLVGGEVVEREAQVLRQAIDELRKRAEEEKLLLKTVDSQTEKSIDDLSTADFTDIFDKKRLEMRLFHSQTSYSRTVVIAPNPATARGWSGSVLLDEIGFIKDFKDLMEAVEPITSTDPSFNLLMATTLPKDDAHYAWELSVPPGELSLPVNPNGRFYRSNAGIVVHRWDAFDAAEAGVQLYDVQTAEPVSVNEHRAKSLDRDAWDRNYGLRFMYGGTCAVSLTTLAMAQELGRGKCLAVEIDADSDLVTALEQMRPLLGAGAVGIGFDVATTEKEQSNPSSIAVVEKVGVDFIPRLILRWKTSDPERAREIVESVLAVVVSRQAGGRAKRLAIDATNEKYFATDLKRALGGRVSVLLAVASETVKYGTEEMTLKQFMGNNLVNALDDGHFFLPTDRWIRNDFRLVFRDKGSFKNECDSSGNHADSFDACKLALWALNRPGGRAWASAAPVGEYEDSSTS